MGLLDKMKNLFTEEVEVEVEEQQKEIKKEKKVHKEKVEPEEEIQKEVIQVEIPSPVAPKEEVKKPAAKEKKEEYKFPFFDDNDFDTIDTVDIRKRSEEKKTRKEMYNPPKEEKKMFKPSPIISPVYGFLDKNYQKDELIQKHNDYNPRKATVDEIRDKAYGSLESDIETTLFGKSRDLFEEKEEARHEKRETREEKKVSLPEEVKPDDELTDLLEAEMAKPEKKVDEKPRKISDKELFNLIDSMYEKEIK